MNEMKLTKRQLLVYSIHLHTYAVLSTKVQTKVIKKDIQQSSRRYLFKENRKRPLFSIIN